MNFKEFAKSKAGIWVNVYFEQESWTTGKFKVHDDFLEVMNPNGKINAIRLACVSSIFELADDTFQEAERQYAETLLKKKTNAKNTT